MSLIRNTLPCPRAGKFDADQRLKDLEASVELTQFQVEAVLGKRSTIDSGPDLPVDGQRVQITNTQLGLRLGDCRGSKGGRTGRGTCRNKKFPPVHVALLL
jgi:hypothetical protein